MWQAIFPGCQEFTTAILGGGGGGLVLFGGWFVFYQRQWSSTLACYSSGALGGLVTFCAMPRHRIYIFSSWVVRNIFGCPYCIFSQGLPAAASEHCTQASTHTHTHTRARTFNPITPVCLIQSCLTSYSVLIPLGPQRHRQQMLRANPRSAPQRTQPCEAPITAP